VGSAKGESIMIHNSMYIFTIEAFVRLKQHPGNKIEQLNKLESFGALYPSFPPAFLKDEYFEKEDT